MRGNRLNRQPRTRAVLLPVQPVVSRSQCVPDPPEVWEEEERDGVREHSHYCDVCCTNWIHDNEYCVGGGPARCPEHEEE